MSKEVFARWFIVRLSRPRRRVDYRAIECLGGELVGRDLGARLAFHCPCLESDDQDLAGHDEGRQSHADGEGKHRVKFVVFHGVDHGASLE